MKSSKVNPRLLWAALGLSIVGCAKTVVPPPPPPPPYIAAKIVAAKRIFVSNLGSDEVAAANLPGGADGSYNTFVASLQQWGYFRLVSSPNDADLIFTIRSIKRQEIRDHTGPGMRQRDYTLTAFPAFITVSVIDPSDQLTLWVTRVQYLSFANRRKTEIKQFDEAIEGLTDQFKALVPGSNAAPSH